MNIKAQLKFKLTLRLESIIETISSRRLPGRFSTAFLSFPSPKRVTTARLKSHVYSTILSIAREEEMDLCLIKGIKVKLLVELFTIFCLDEAQD